MAKVRDVADIVPPRGVTRGGDLAAQSFLVWKAARGSKKQLRHKMYREGVPGHVFEGNLTRVILSLWPELSGKSREERLKAFRADIYQFLRQSGNAVCIDQGGIEHKGVKWWIRDEWNAAGSVIVLGRLRPTTTERRLTPAEAGEDRPPSPVVVTQVSVNSDGTTITMRDGESMTTATVAPEAPAPTNGFTESAARKAAEREAMVEMAAQLLAEETEGEPLVADEVAFALGVHNSTARSVLEQLLASGRAFSRMETAEERTLRYGGPWRATRAQLYSATRPVPPRTKREVVQGFVMELKSKDAPSRRRYELDSEVLRILTSTFTSVADIVRRIPGEVSEGSVRITLNRLAEQGKVQAKRKKIGGVGPIRMHYRKTRNYAGTPVQQTVATPPAPVPPIPEVVAPASVPQSALASEIAELVNRLAEQAQSGNSDAERVRELEGENAELRRQIADLESAIAPLRAILSR